MYSVRGNQEIIDEIKDEYIKGALFSHVRSFIKIWERNLKNLI